jgi:hypothetical protein
MTHKTVRPAHNNKDDGKRQHPKFEPVDKAPFDLTANLTDDVLPHAIKDARQAKDSALQQEALAWLWVCCPDVADELALPTPEETSAIQPDITGYLQRYSVFSLA